VSPAAVFTAEDVLYRPSASIAASEVIFTGINLYRALRSTTPTHVVCDTPHRDLAAVWLKLNGLADALCHTQDAETLPATEFRWRVIARLRAQGPIWLVVTADAELARLCTEQGLYVALFVRPGVSVADLPPRETWDERQQSMQEDILRRLGKGPDDDQAD